MKRPIPVLLIALLSVAGCASGDDAPDPPDDFVCGPSNTELLSRIGTLGLPAHGPRRVRFVIDEGMPGWAQVAWFEAIEDWRSALEAACPFVPEIATGPTGSKIDGFDGTTRDASPPDVVELRVDDPQPYGHDGNGWSFPACRSGRATMSAAARDVHRVTRHELGHAFGNLPHDETGEPSIMSNTSPIPWRDIMPMDVANYARFWCAPRPASGGQP